MALGFQSKELTWGTLSRQSSGGTPWDASMAQNHRLYEVGCWIPKTINSNHRVRTGQQGRVRACDTCRRSRLRVHLEAKEHLELPENIYVDVKALCSAGDASAEVGNLNGAINYYESAFDRLPEPRHDWEAATWILAAMGDAWFSLGIFEECKRVLTTALNCPGGATNAFVHLRLGQSLFELGEISLAQDHLARAFMAGGKEIFEGEDKKYLQCLRTVLRDFDKWVLPE